MDKLLLSDDVFYRGVCKVLEVNKKFECFFKGLGLAEVNFGSIGIISLIVLCIRGFVTIFSHRHGGGEKDFHHSPGKAGRCIYIRLLSALQIGVKIMALCLNFWILNNLF